MMKIRSCGSAGKIAPRSDGRMISKPLRVIVSIRGLAFAFSNADVDVARLLFTRLDNAACTAARKISGVVGLRTKSTAPDFIASMAKKLPVVYGLLITSAGMVRSYSKSLRLSMSKAW